MRAQSQKKPDQFDAADFDALALPGGFGAAKNLSSFAFDGAMNAMKAMLGLVEDT